MLGKGDRRLHGFRVKPARQIFSRQVNAEGFEFGTAQVQIKGNIVLFACLQRAEQFGKQISPYAPHIGKNKARFSTLVTAVQIDHSGVIGFFPGFRRAGSQKFRAYVYVFEIRVGEKGFGQGGNMNRNIAGEVPKSKFAW